MFKFSRLASVVLVIVMFTSAVQAQDKKERKGEFYFSWGYNAEWFTHSKVTIDQPELNNHYSFNQVRGHDRVGWDNRLFKKDLTIPQYNYRLGYFFNKKKGYGFEINFDHTKFLIRDEQPMSLTGTLGGRQVDTTIMFSKANGFHYYLNNGANFLLFNFVKRWHFVNNKKETIKIDALAKAGIGPVFPHVDNKFFGQQNIPNFQFGGWNVGVEGDIRATFFNHVFLEYGNKLDYARYAHLHIYKGDAKQAFGTYEMILSLGLTFPMGKHI